MTTDRSDHMDAARLAELREARDQTARTLRITRSGVAGENDPRLSDIQAAADRAEAAFHDYLSSFPGRT